jgi:hypothetical protein
MNRTLQPDLLDELPATDQRAIHSRRDLRRINSLMGNARTLKRYLEPQLFGEFVTLVEIGAGDGNIGFQIAEHFSAARIAGRLILVDQQPVLSQATTAPRHWTHEVVQADVFEWLGTTPKVDVIVANLFLHHFESEQLRTLLPLIARSTNVFASAEPLRGKVASWFARKVWTIGCNEVTCHDAEISVKAGFVGDELSRLWPRGWKLTEKRAGLFTHFFGAIRQP